MAAEDQGAAGVCSEAAVRADLRGLRRTGESERSSYFLRKEAVAGNPCGTGAPKKGE